LEPAQRFFRCDVCAPSCITPRAIHIDFDLLLVLFALLITVEILRMSGYLDWVVARSVTRFRTTRGFALALIVFSGVLAAIVTNDVALFVVIPFTIIASRFSDFDVEDAVILEIVATNLIGCLTPLGNPQNLFVFHQSGWSAVQFIAVMLPFVAWCAAGLVIATLFLGPSRPMTRNEVDLPQRDNRAAIAGLICLAFVILEVARLLPAWIAAALALIAGVVFLQRRLFKVDFTIIPIFCVAFLLIGWMQQSLNLRLPIGLYPAAIVSSQVISNVPATVLLAPFTTEWRELLYAVNAAGCGTIIASLANLLGWRIYVRESNRDAKFFHRLTAINVVFLLWAAAGGWLLLKAY
jgi:Na+/H+ antiporter NhaD/arsenite permease-like protein